MTVCKMNLYDGKLSLLLCDVASVLGELPAGYHRVRRRKLTAGQTCR